MQKRLSIDPTSIVTRWVLPTAAGLMLLAASVMADERRHFTLDPNAVRQKAVFLENLVTKSVAAKTLEMSKDAAAIGALERARALVGQAQKDVESNDFKAAEEKLNDALRLVNTETRRLSQHRVTEEHLQTAYDKRLHSVRAFLKAYERVAQEKGSSSIAARQEEMLTRIIAEAENNARAGKLADAKAALDKAYHITKTQLREMRGGDTLVRTLNFETPKDEYAYEVDRNDSHKMLLKIAIGEQKPGAKTVELIEKLRAKAMDLRAVAENRAKDGDYKAAVQSLEASTQELLKAIRLSGLFVPG